MFDMMFTMKCLMVYQEYVVVYDSVRTCRPCMVDLFVVKDGNNLFTRDRASVYHKYS